MGRTIFYVLLAHFGKIVLTKKHQLIFGFIVNTFKIFIIMKKCFECSFTNFSPMFCSIEIFWKLIRHYSILWCVVGYVVSLVLRLCAGDDLVGLPPTIKYPGYNPDMGGQLFPFRTFALICSIVVTTLTSLIARFILYRLPPRHDFLHCVHRYWQETEECNDSHLEINAYGKTPTDSGSVLLEEF